MYESPVDVVYNQMRTGVDNHIFKAIVDVGVNVNKEELIKALQYDRGQYDKGYKDGCDDSQAEIERLTNKCEDCAGCSEWKCDCSLIKSQAIEEFAEELKTRIKNAVFCCYDLRFKNHLQELLNIIVAKIDNLVKEMTEVSEK